MESNIIMLAWDDPTRAEDMLLTFLTWQAEGLITIDDAVLAVRGQSPEVEIRQTQSVTGKYTLRGTGIGLLAGVLLGGPVGGLVAGAAIGAISGHMKDIGIDNKFIRDAAQALSPNSSALFVMGRADDPEGFYKELKPYRAVVAMTTLAPAQEKRLRDALVQED